MYKTYILLLVIHFSLILSSCHPQNQPIPTVEVRKEGDQFILYRHGEPYYIQGVAGTNHMAKVAQYGGNSVRTWHVDDAQRILDEAEANGLTVTLGLPIGKAAWGRDFNYANLLAVEQKITEILKIVEQYKDHPALLMWGVGNEVYLHGGNPLLVLLTINRIAKKVQETDPNHPVMTTLSASKHFFMRGFFDLLCPNLDLIGINNFQRLPELYDDMRGFWSWDRAYIVSEWGSPGPWETSTTDWGAPLEPNSSQKAWFFETNWQHIQKDTSRCLGSYAFYWGNKYERTHTFMSLFLHERYETESVEKLKTHWTQRNPENHVPHIDSLVIHTVNNRDNKYLLADSLYEATIFTYDADQDSLLYRWEIRPEGESNTFYGSYEHNLKYLMEQPNQPTLHFRTPAQEGGYRLFAYVYDGQQHVATHNTPFYVILK